jgi:hypothetical protein
VNQRKTEGWLLAGLLFGPLPTLVFGLAAAVLVGILRLVLSVLAAFAWAWDRYFRWLAG